MSDVSVLTRSLRTIDLSFRFNPLPSKRSHGRRFALVTISPRRPSWRRRQGCNFREQYSNRNG
jgi:hypothetical protein